LEFTKWLFLLYAVPSDRVIYLKIHLKPINHLLLIALDCINLRIKIVSI
jgi:hypothetical protein